MIKLRNRSIEALAAVAVLGVGSAAVPAAALTASHPAHTTKSTDLQSPDLPGVNDTSPDRKADRGHRDDRGDRGHRDDRGDRGDSVDHGSDR